MQNYSPSNFPPSPPGMSPVGGGQPAPKSKLPWIIAGGVGCLLLIVIAVAALGGLAYVASRNQPSPTTPVPSPSPVAETIRYVNSKAALSKDFHEHYVDFSFNYPDTWALDDKAGKAGASNYVKVSRDLDTGQGGSFTLENFAVGQIWYSSLKNLNRESIFKQLMAQFAPQLAKNFPGFAKVSEGAVTVNFYEGYEMRFTSSIKETSKGEIDLWGRVILLPDESSRTKGVAIIMLASNLAPELDGPEDVGEKGELPAILNSFRFGK